MWEEVIITLSDELLTKITEPSLMRDRIEEVRGCIAHCDKGNDESEEGHSEMHFERETRET